MIHRLDSMTLRRRAASAALFPAMDAPRALSSAFSWVTFSDGTSTVAAAVAAVSVSYTHLTLPTILRV